MNDPDQPQAFLSYAHVDDDALDGGITWLREELEKILRSLTGQSFAIFQDENGIELGQHWPSRLENALKSVRFLIPILTPSYFARPACRAEAELFLDYEMKAGRNDLVLPIYLIEVDVLEDPALRRDELLAKRLHQRQFADWRDIAFQLKSAPGIKQRLADLARKIQTAAKRDREAIPPLVADQELGIRFRVNEEGLIDRAPDEGPDITDDDTEMLAKREGLIEASDLFLGGFEERRPGDNSDRRLINAVKAYKESITGPLSQIQYTEVWRLGSRLQNASDACARKIARMGLPDLEDEQQAALNDLLVEHGPFIYAARAGRAEQSKADRFKATLPEQREKWQQNARFKDVVSAEARLFAPAARAVVTEVNEVDEDADQLNYPERQLVMAETTNKNLLSVVGKVAVGSTAGDDLATIDQSTIDRVKQFLFARESVLKILVASSRYGLAWFGEVMNWLRKSDGNEGLGRADTPRVKIDPLSRPPGTVFLDIDEPWCPEMVVIPAGSFMMGSPEDEAERNNNEGPQHLVTIKKSFALGRYPVTFEEFDSFCERSGCKNPDDEGLGRGRRPVINITWKDAAAYCEWLTHRTGADYRLPSEARWEYACRAGTETRFAFGDNLSDSEANFGRKLSKTTETGAYPPNPFGLFDMHGNVWEWCDDIYHDSYEGAPDNGGARFEKDGTMRVLRGGSWDYLAQDLRSAGRHALPPGSRDNRLGFRCARVQERP